MAKTEEFEERLTEARVAKKSKSSDTVTAGSGSVGVDEEFACHWRKPKKLWKTVMAWPRVPPGPHRTFSCQHACVLRTIVGDAELRVLLLK